MKKIILGVLAAAIVVAPIAATVGPASAADAPASTCVPSPATPSTSHTEYQWAALVVKGGLHWEYKWTTTGQNPTTDLLHIWVKSLDLTKRNLPQITRTVSDPGTPAKTCSVTLPEHFAGEGTYSVVVPYVRGVDTFLLGVQGYDEHVAITHDVTVTKAMAGQFWIGHQARPGYLIANPNSAQWHIDFQFATGTEEILLDGETGTQLSKTLELPDTFPTLHTGDPQGDYYSTQVELTLNNTSAVDKSVNVMYRDVQDGDRVWIERGVFKDVWYHETLVPAHSTKTFVFDVWYNVPTTSPNVPSDLTLDFSVTATPQA